MDDEQELRGMVMNASALTYMTADRGTGLIATRSLARGDTVLAEEPVAALQSAESKAASVACARCFRPVGAPMTALFLQAGECSRTELISGAKPAPELPKVPGTLESHAAEGVCCQLGCGEVYCCSECCARALEDGHRLLCVGPLDSTSHPLYKFKEFALETCEEFLLAAQVVAAMVSAAQRLAGAEGQAEVRPDHMEQALQPYAALLSGKPWWEVCAVPDEEKQSESDYRRLLKSQAREAWDLLTRGLQQAHGVTKAQLPLILSSQLWGKLLGALEHNCQRLSLPPPLVQYCRHLAAAPYSTRLAALELLRPHLQKALERVDNESDMDSDSCSDSQDLTDEDDAIPCVDNNSPITNYPITSPPSPSKDLGDATLLADVRLLGHQAQEVLEGTEVVGFFRALSAVNHSCHPNCEVILQNEPDAHFAARAVLRVTRTEVCPGEELTISFIDGDGTREDRQAALQPYAFTCRCSRCTFEERMALRRINPAEVPVHELRALAQLAVKEERYEDAAQAYKALLAGCPHDGDSFHGLGVALLNQDRWSEAYQTWMDGARACPEHEALKEESLKATAYSDTDDFCSVPTLYNNSCCEFRQWRITLPADPSAKHEDSCVYLSLRDTPMFSAEECVAVIGEAESAAAAHASGWTTSRHYSVPTTDIPVHKLPRTLRWFKTALAEKLGPMLAAQYPEGVKCASRVRVHDAFVVKYDAKAQKGLPMHSDQSHYSLTIALNSLAEYEGGGTFFEALGETIRPDQGQLASFPGHLSHQGSPITSGLRYIIAAFLYVVDEDRKAIA